VENPEDVDVDQPRKTRGVRPDHRYLDNPFRGEGEEKESYLGLEEIYTIIAGDKLNSLVEAKSSPDWSEWRIAINEELKLLNEMGTWKLVEKPLDAITIPNK
jgi:hypothetical protein